MKKKLPSIKKSLAGFICEEDAKVIDKTASKIAISASFIALNLAANIDDANAKGHKNHSNHNNHVFDKSSDPLLQHNDVKNTDEPITRSYTIEDDEAGVTETLDVEVPPKGVAVAHGNHFNHINGSGKS